MLRLKNHRWPVTIVCILLLSILVFFATRLYLTPSTKAQPTHPTISTKTPSSRPIPTPNPNYGYIARKYTDTRGFSLTYYLYLPPHYNPQQKYPLVLLLHGGGERSSPRNTPEQNEQALMRNQYVQVWSTQYSAPYNPEIQQRWPSFVVVPQLGPSQGWVNADVRKGSYLLTTQPSTNLLLTKELLDSLQREYTSIDANRLYITGISLGAYAIWDAIERWPNYFAAAAPVAGAGDPSKASRLIHLPIWAFHGSKDASVPVAGSRNMIKAIRAAGGQPRYTEIAGAGHGIWGYVYSLNASHIDGFYPWLFSQRK